MMGRRGFQRRCCNDKVRRFVANLYKHTAPGVVVIDKIEKSFTFFDMTPSHRSPPRQGNPKVLVAIGLGYSYGRNMVAGIVNYAREHGPWEFIGQVGPMVEPAAITQAPRYDGVIFHQMVWGMAERVIRRAAPAVSVGGDPVHPKIPHVTADNQAVARMAFTYFRELGFERFAVYGGSAVVRKQRIEAFTTLVQQAGFHCVDLGVGGRAKWFNTNENKRWVREIRQLKKVLPKLDSRTAVFAWSSEEARPVVVACDELNIRVPDEIAVLGVDDDEAICELASPPISAIDHGCETIGWEAARMLDMLMRGEKPAHNIIRVDPVRVVVRQSTNTLAVDDPMLVKAIRFIQSHFAEPIITEDVLREVEVSRPKLEKLFRHAIGRSVHAQIVLERINHAKQLLHATRLDLATISIRCGFSYPSKFSAVFLRETGMSPSLYRERCLIRRTI